MDADNCNSNLEDILCSINDVASEQEQQIWIQEAVAKYYKLEYESLSKENAELEMQMKKDTEELEEMEKKITDVNNTNQSLRSAISTTSNVMRHLIARRNEAESTMKHWENKINKRVKMMDDFIKEETQKRENENDLYKQVVDKRNEFKEMQIKYGTLLKREEMLKRQIKERKEINEMLYRSRIVEFARAVTDYNRSIQLDKDIAAVKSAISEMAIKLNAAPKRKLFQGNTNLNVSLQQNPFNKTSTAQLKTSVNVLKEQSGASKSIHKKQDKNVLKSSDKKVIRTTSTTSSILKPQVKTSSGNNDLQELRQRSVERKRNYLQLMSQSFDEILNTSQEAKKTPEGNNKKDEKPNVLENTPKKKKVDVINDITIKKPLEDSFSVPKPPEERKTKKVCFNQQPQHQKEQEVYQSNNNNNNQSNNSIIVDDQQFQETFVAPPMDNSLWAEANNKPAIFALTSPERSDGTSLILSDGSAGINQGDFFMSENSGDPKSPDFNFGFNMGHQSTNNQFSFF